ncbi:NAD(P)-binding domain protein [Metarhizium rileyi]|uniref:NAD(P)-binding domain protein n=1 Tax=Metarhizium rileyi (strain RCEF 4871) TaxID=1649241 RepID=A0A167FQS7_METRR|nr:NAD(P)-binding domain protein [Metarhizium rileyi RCEF 4871]
MLITIIPASTKSGTAVIRSILAAPNAGIAVQAVYRDTTRAPTEFTSMPNFAAVKGDIADKSSLNFKGSDAAIAITPPVFDRGDLVAIAQERSENVKNAIERSGTVNKVILLSSIGAQFSSGVGEIKTNNIAERVFAETNIAEVIFVRCAYFMENWTAAPETLRGPEPFFFSTVTPLEWKLPMVAVEDIGAVIASEALKQQGSPRKPHVFELHGPRMYSPLDVQLAFSDALGKQVAVRPVQREELHGFYRQVFPEDVVPEWVEMATSFLPGGVMKPGDVEEGTGVVNGKTELGDAIRSAVQRFL